MCPNYDIRFCGMREREEELTLFICRLFPMPTNVERQFVNINHAMPQMLIDTYRIEEDEATKAECIQVNTVSSQHVV